MDFQNMVAPPYKKDHYAVIFSSQTRLDQGFWNHYFILGVKRGHRQLEKALGSFIGPELGAREMVRVLF